MEREGLAENVDGSDANEENKLISDMDKEKAKYADVCGRLRNEKAAIEHIQKLMTTARGKLQADFDEWYGQCMSAEARHKVRGTAPPEAEAKHEAAQTKSRNQEVKHGTGNAEADEDIAAYEQAKQELYVMQRRQAQQR